MIPLASLLQSFPRLLSINDFLWAMFAQCEWPAIAVTQYRTRGLVEQAQRWLRYFSSPLLLILLPWFLLCKSSSRGLFRALLRRLLGDFRRLLWWHDLFSGR